MSIQNLVKCIHDEPKITFIIGAGASVSGGIPLAQDLIKDARKRYLTEMQGMDEKDKNNYNKTMMRIGKDKCREIIQDKLDKSRVNWGHLALMSLISSPLFNDKICRILSFNFDFLAERSASIIGKHIPVYDFALAPANEEHIKILAEHSLIHLHGQSNGFVMLNGEDEISKHTNNLSPIIKDSLQNHLTIVIGYSGQSDDAFKIISEWSTIDRKIFWLGYDQYAPHNLRPLIKDKKIEYIPSCDFDEAMVIIAKELNCWPIKILDNPLEYAENIILLMKNITPHQKEHDLHLKIMETIHHRIQRINEKWKDSINEKEKLVEKYIRGQDNPDIYQIDNTSNEEIRDMATEILNAEANHLINSLRQVTESDYKEAIKKYAHAFKIHPDRYQLLENEGSAYQRLSKMFIGDKRDKLEESAKEIFVKAARMAEKNHDVLSILHALLNVSSLSIKSTIGREIDQKSENILLEEQKNTEEALEKLQDRAFFIQKNKFEHMNYHLKYNLACIRMELSRHYAIEDRNKYLESAEELLREVNKYIDHANYMVACIYSLQGNESKALKELEDCLEANTLPTRNELEKDENLTCLHSNPRFQALLDSAPPH